MRYSSLAILAACSLATHLAQAQSIPYTPGKITFEGEVSAQTCHASVNGQSAALVLLPTVPAAELKDSNTTAGLTPFTLSVTGCTQDDSADLPITVKFLGRNVTSAGNLGNMSPNSKPATNVAIQLTDNTNNSTSITLKNDAPVAVKGLKLPAKADSASYDFAARYISEEGNATPGPVQAIVEYSLSYQ